MYACYSVFNEAENEKEAENLRSSINSIVPFVVKVVAVDGPYRGFPHNSLVSQDSTKQIFTELCKDKLIWVEKNKAWPTQSVKRNEYLKYVPTGSWFFVIDGDEVAQGNVAAGFAFAESSRYNCVSVKVVNYLPKHPSVKIVMMKGHPHILSNISEEEWPTLGWESYSGFGTRLYRRLQGMEYRGHHSTIFVGLKLVSRAQAKLEDLCLVNMVYGRSWSRWQMSQSYKLQRLRSGQIDA